MFGGGEAYVKIRASIKLVPAPGGRLLQQEGATGGAADADGDGDYDYNDYRYTVGDGDGYTYVQPQPSSVWVALARVTNFELFQNYVLYTRVCQADGGFNLGNGIQDGSDYVTKAKYPIKPGGGVVNIQQSFPVPKDGTYHVLIVTCPATGGFAASPAAAPPGHVAESYVEFYGARGFLPGTMWAYLPFYGILFCLYTVILCWFSCLLWRNKESVLGLQWAIFAVMALGMVETAAWFFTNVRMNFTGHPSCCPMRSDLVVSWIVQTVKQTVSRLLLLSVCMGFGVVRPRLSKRLTTVLVVLGASFCGASLMNELVYINGLSDTSVETPQESTFWKMIEAAVDAVIIIAIYAALRSVSEDLQKTGQTAKLEMYERLARALFGAISLFVVYSIAAIVIVKVKGDIVPWRYGVVFVRDSIWEIFFIIILVAIAWIWRPCESTTRYAYSHQLRQELDDDEEEEEDDDDDDSDKDVDDDDEEEESFDYDEAERVANGSDGGDDDKKAVANVGDVELTVLEAPHEGQEPVADVTLT